MEVTLLDFITQERKETDLQSASKILNLTLAQARRKLTTGAIVKHSNALIIKSGITPREIKKLLSAKTKFAGKEEEIWRRSPLTNSEFMVSSLGRVKRIKPNGEEIIVMVSRRKAKKSRKTNQDISLVKIKGEEGSKQISLKRLVVSAFNPIEYESGVNIVHRDRDTWNCSVENLKVVDNSTLSSLSILSRKDIKAIVQYDQCTLEPLAVYSSIATACKIVGVTTVGRAVKNWRRKDSAESLAKGFRFRAIENKNHFMARNPHLVFYQSEHQKRAKRILSS